MDMRLIPMLALLYLLSFLDRTSPPGLPQYQANLVLRRKHRKRKDRRPPGGSQYDSRSIQLVSYCFLLHIRRLRSPLQPPPQKAPTQRLASYNHDCLGCRHDIDGHCPELYRPSCRSRLSRSDRGWSFPWRCRKSNKL